MIVIDKLIFFDIFIMYYLTIGGDCQDLKVIEKTIHSIFTYF
jgi:hypothetical protein